MQRSRVRSSRRPPFDSAAIAASLMASQSRRVECPERARLHASRRASLPSDPGYSTDPNKRPGTGRLIAPGGYHCVPLRWTGVCVAGSGPPPADGPEKRDAAGADINAARALFSPNLPKSVINESIESPVPRASACRLAQLRAGTRLADHSETASPFALAVCAGRSGGLDRQAAQRTGYSLRPNA